MQNFYYRYVKKIPLDSRISPDITLTSIPLARNSNQSLNSFEFSNSVLFFSYLRGAKKRLRVLRRLHLSQNNNGHSFCSATR